MSGQSAPRTVIELLRLSTQYLAGRGVDSPRLDAEVLLAHILGLDRIGLYVNYDRPLEPGEVDRYRTAIARRGRREPVAYILGEKEFMGRPFAVTPAVLIPRPETEQLVEAVVQRLANLPVAEFRLLDVGTGSGVIAVMLALLLPQAVVTAVDISPAALAVASGNVERHGVGNRVRLREGDLFSALPEGAAFDAIVSNPPYIEADQVDRLAPEVRQEPRQALAAGPDGLAVIRRLVSGARSYLAPGGLLALEIGAGQGQAVQALAAEHGYSDIVVEADYAGRDRMAFMRAPGEAEIL